MVISLFRIRDFPKSNPKFWVDGIETSPILLHVAHFHISTMDRDWIEMSIDEKLNHLRERDLVHVKWCDLLEEWHHDVWDWLYNIECLLQDLDTRLDNQERWLWKTYMWLKEFYQGWGEGPHSSFIIARSTTSEERCQGHVGNLKIPIF